MVENYLDIIMDLQYILDDKGNKTNVIIPIDQWNKLIQDLFVKKQDDIPQWQIDEVNSRIQELEENPNLVKDFDEMLLRIKSKYEL